MSPQTVLAWKTVAWTALVVLLAQHRAGSSPLLRPILAQEKYCLSTKRMQNLVCHDFHARDANGRLTSHDTGVRQNPGELAGDKKSFRRKVATLFSLIFGFVTQSLSWRPSQ